MSIIVVTFIEHLVGVSLCLKCPHSQLGGELPLCHACPSVTAVTHPVLIVGTQAFAECLLGRKMLCMALLGGGYRNLEPVSYEMTAYTCMSLC